MTGVLSVARTLLYKEVLRFWKVAFQTVAAPVLTAVLYLLIFSHVLEDRVQVYGQLSYTAFLVPGLVMMTLITSAYMNTVSTFYFAKFIKNIEELLVSPMPSWVIVAGFVAGGVMRAFLVGFLVVITSLFFTHLEIYNILIVFAAAFLTAFLFSLAGIVNGFFAKSFDAISIIPTFVLTPLTYLGGVFYSIELLPEPWRTLSLYNPILYMVNAFRYGFLGVADVNIFLAFGVLIGLTILFFLITLWMFIKGAGFKN